MTQVADRSGRWLRSAVAGLLLGVFPAAAAQGQVELVSEVPPDRTSDTVAGVSGLPSISADGRYVVFASEAPNLVPEQVRRTHAADLFLYDRATGERTLVSRSADSATAGGNDHSSNPALSADGRFIAFLSYATNLVPGQDDDNREADVFLYDQATGTTTLVSHTSSSRETAGDGRNRSPAISADGRFVVFTSRATNLVRGQQDSPGSDDIFLYDHRSGEVMLVSRAGRAAVRTGDRESFLPSISADGRLVTFLSLAKNLFPGQNDRNEKTDAFLFDTVAKRTILISRAASSPVETANESVVWTPALTTNNADVVYGSLATNVVPGQSSRVRVQALYLFERSTGKTTLVSRSASSPAKPGNSNAGAFRVSADGNYIAFHSNATDLVAGQVSPGAANAVFLYTRSTGRVTLISGANGSPARVANGSSYLTGISADGVSILFESYATDLVRNVTNAPDTRDVFLFNRRSGKISLVSASATSPGATANGSSSDSRLSADGKWIAFVSAATDLLGDVRDSNAAPDVVLQGRGIGSRELASLRDPDLPSATGQGESGGPSISADGRYVAFQSDAAELLPEGAPREMNVFLRDRVAGATTRVSRSAGFSPTISADGRYVAYLSAAPDEIPGQVDEEENGADVFLWDRMTGQILLVSHAHGAPAVATNTARSLTISADGSFVAFTSSSDKLVPNQIGLGENVFLYDRTSGTATLVSRISGTAATAGGGFGPVLSVDGRFIAFTSSSWSLVPDVTFFNDVSPANAFLYDRISGTTTLVTRTTAPQPTAGGGHSIALSADGRYLLFGSIAPDLVPGQVDLPQSADLFLYDRISGTRRLVSHTTASPATAANNVFDGSLSADGRFVAFGSGDPDHVPGQIDTDGSSDVFVFDRDTGAIVLVSRKSGTTTASGGGHSPRISADGRFVAFLGGADLVPGQTETFARQIFLWNRVTGAMELASRSLAGPTVPGFGDSESAVISANGIHVAFTSFAPNLVSRDFNKDPKSTQPSLPDVFAYTSPGS